MILHSQEVSQTFQKLRTAAKTSCEDQTINQSAKIQLYSEITSFLILHWNELFESLPRDFQTTKPQSSILTIDAIERNYKHACSWWDKKGLSAARQIIENINFDEYEKISQYVGNGGSEVKILIPIKDRILTPLSVAVLEFFNSYCEPVYWLIKEEGVIPKDLEKEVLLNLLEHTSVFPIRTATLHFSQHFQVSRQSGIQESAPFKIVKVNDQYELQFNGKRLENVLSHPDKEITTPLCMCPAHKVSGALTQLSGWVFDVMLRPIIDDLYSD